MPATRVDEDLVVLSVNSGSSSLKCALFATDDADAKAVARMQLPVHEGDYAGALHAALDALAARGLPSPGAAGHRVVHGGPRHAEPVRVDAAVLEELEEAVPFAPLHLPAAISMIEAIRQRHPGLPQVACFDTGFHRQMPEVARRLPLPVSLWDAGVRRYGFHGLSYEYVVATVGPRALGRAVVAHLGNGASMAAIRDGVSVDTTMGLTPTGGLVMSTRAGDLDPGVLTYLLREGGYDAERLERLVDHEAGLLGLSGSTSDMRELLEQRDRDPRSALAIEVFCVQASKYVGALSAVLDGLDTLVFTGGIGEKAAPVRAEVCQRLGHLGVQLDPQSNARHAEVISAPDSRCVVRVVPTDEDLVIARHTRAVVTAG